MKIKMLGVCGSPVKNGNTEAFLVEALKVAGEMEGVSTELVTLARRNISSCLHCNWCLRSQKEGQFCNQKDDMIDIYPLILEADGLVLASPVYFGRLSGYLANFIDRLRVFTEGKYYRHRLEDKVGGALAVSWFRARGEEMTLLTINNALGRLGMLTFPGAAGVASSGGTGKFDPNDKLMVLKDEYGLESAHRLAKRMVEVIRIVKLGKEALARGQAIN